MKMTAAEVAEYFPEPVVVKISVDNLGESKFKRTWDYFFKPTTYRLKENWKVTCPWDGEHIMLPAGTVSDGASVPWFLKPFMSPTGPMWRAGWVHDYGYANNKLLDWEGNDIMVSAGREYFDQKFRNIIGFTTNLNALAFWAWSGVRTFGWIPWNKHRGYYNGTS